MTQAQKASYQEDPGREGLRDCHLDYPLNSDCEEDPLMLAGLSSLSLMFW